MGDQTAPLLQSTFGSSSISHQSDSGNMTIWIWWVKIIKLHEVSEGEETHEWWSRPKTITSVFLLPQKSHECGFIFILCHKNYRKTTFNSGSPHAKFAMTSGWHYANVATTSRRPVQQYAWRHWDCAMTLTQQRKSVYHICCIWYFYTTPGYHGSIAGLKFK
jgi:hypothetical protein